MIKHNNSRMWQQSTRRSGKLRWKWQPNYKQTLYEVSQVNKALGGRVNCDKSDNWKKVVAMWFASSVSILKVHKASITVW